MELMTRIILHQSWCTSSGFAVVKGLAAEYGGKAVLADRRGTYGFLDLPEPRSVYRLREYKKIAERFAYNNKLPDACQVVGVELRHFDKLKLRMRPYPFQQEAIRRMTKAPVFLNADQMGLGKSMQALVAINRADAYPCLVVTTATMRDVLVQEIKKVFSKPTVIAVHGSEVRQALRNHHFVVTNYEQLARLSPSELKLIQPYSIIFDESHYLKTQSSKRSKACKLLARAAQKIILLTGTPITNRLTDLKNQLSIMRKLHLVFNGPKPFDMQYIRWSNGLWPKPLGVKNSEELCRKLAPFYIRRLRSEVMAELPSVTRKMVMVELSNKDEYRFARDKFIEWVHTINPTSIHSALMAEGLVKMAKLRQLSGLGKVWYAKQYIQELLDSGEKVVVFTAHRETLRQLVDNRHLFIDGDTDKAVRAQRIDAFQNSTEPLAIIVNLKAGGTGITLTAASICVFVELDWSPANMLQAEDRICRIGQKAKHVEAVYLLGKHTIDNALVKALLDKTKAISRVVSGSSLAGITKEEDPQQKLLRLYMRKMHRG